MDDAYLEQLRREAEHRANARARRVRETPELVKALQAKGADRVHNRTARRRCLQTGSGEGVMDTPRFTCLTNRQWGKLFGTKAGKRPRKLGCGSFACVYQGRDNNKVVKLTSDPTDVAATIAAQGIPHVVTLYHYGKVQGGHYGDPRGGYTDPTYDERFAMVLEKLRPIRDIDAKLLARNWMRCARDMQRAQPAKRHERCCTLPADIRIGRGARKKVTKAMRENCHRIVGATTAVNAAFKRRGIAFTDWHGGNIGRDKAGHWKLLDLGFSGKKIGSDVRELRGGWRR